MDSFDDPVLAAEIALLGEVMAAVAQVPRELTDAEVDDVLGLDDDAADDEAADADTDGPVAHSVPDPAPHSVNDPAPHGKTPVARQTAG